MPGGRNRKDTHPYNQPRLGALSSPVHVPQAEDDVELLSLTAAPPHNSPVAVETPAPIVWWAVAAQGHGPVAAEESEEVLRAGPRSRYEHLNTPSKPHAYTAWVTALTCDIGIDRREQSGAQKYDKQRGKCRDTRNQVFEELDKSMRGSREETKFICRDDVKQAWSGTDSVSKALFPGKFKIEDLRRIMQDYILVLSILTFIGAHDILDRFEEHFLGEATKHRCDENLPFLDEDLDFFTDLASRGKFKASQYLFIPEEISESEFQNTQVIDPLKRLPFEHVSDAAFKGGYADVKEVTISPRYFKDNNRHSNDEVRSFPDLKFIDSLSNIAQSPK